MSTRAIGDSVMLGAAGELADLDFVVDAEESRPFMTGLDIVRAPEEADRLPDTMVAHLGGDGPIGAQNMAEFVGVVVDSVWLLTSAINRDDNASNNELVFTTAAANENIQLLDWSGFAASCTGDCFEDDGFHLKPDGRVYSEALIAESVIDDS